jgi:hypothetical protein
MKKFITRILSFFFPFLVVVMAYVVLDPFMVLKGYDTFFDPKANGWVGLNKDYVSTTTFDSNYQKEQYNSFIFGNSRSIFYQVSDWKRNLKPKSNCYHFDASGEALYSLYKKVKYIESKKLEIKNVLLILDYSTLIQDKPKTGHLFVISPQLENNENLFSFNFEFLKAFLSPKFLSAYIDFKLSGKVKPYMKNDNLIDDRPSKYDLSTNEIRFDAFEALINKGEYYTNDRKSVFYKRDTIQTFSPIGIAVNQKIILKEILDIFVRQKTNYKIIINPLYDQIKLNPQDLDYLIQLFGNENVFDFSGINKFTKDYTNYYESSHYRPHVACEIMELVYHNDHAKYITEK